MTMGHLAALGCASAVLMSAALWVWTIRLPRSSYHPFIFLCAGFTTVGPAIIGVSAVNLLQLEASRTIPANIYLAPGWFVVIMLVLLPASLFALAYAVVKGPPGTTRRSDGR